MGYDLRRVKAFDDYFQEDDDDEHGGAAQWERFSFDRELATKEMPESTDTDAGEAALFPRSLELGPNQPTTIDFNDELEFTPSEYGGARGGGANFGAIGRGDYYKTTASLGHEDAIFGTTTSAQLIVDEVAPCARPVVAEPEEEIMGIDIVQPEANQAKATCPAGKPKASGWRARMKEKKLAHAAAQAKV
jgi:hypothetical protein